MPATTVLKYHTANFFGALFSNFFGRISNCRFGHPELVDLSRFSREGSRAQMVRQALHDPRTATIWYALFFCSTEYKFYPEKKFILRETTNPAYLRDHAVLKVLTGEANNHSVTYPTCCTIFCPSGERIKSINDFTFFSSEVL